MGEKAKSDWEDRTPQDMVGGGCSWEEGVGRVNGCGQRDWRRDQTRIYS